MSTFDWSMGPLFEGKPPFQAHSPTSKAAARSLDPERLGKLQAAVLAAIRERDGATDEEIQICLHLNPSSQRPRRIELVRKGLVRDSGETRKTRAGRQAVVWIAPPR